MYNSAQPEVTEEQTVTIPGEEDLPARTPTPELLGNSSFQLSHFWMEGMPRDEMKAEKAAIAKLFISKIY